MCVCVLMSMTPGSVTIVAEVKEAALAKRHAQGWVVERATDLDDCIKRCVVTTYHT